MKSEALTEARSRVETKTIFETLLLNELISPPQLQAARQFSEDLAAAGALDSAHEYVSPVEAAVDDAALEATLGSLALCDMEDTRCFISAVSGEWVVIPSYVSLEKFAAVVTHCLDCLSSHYGFDCGAGQKDPRAVLRRQLNLG